MSFFDKINNYLIVSAIKEILKGRDSEESLPESVLIFNSHAGLLAC